MLIVKVLIDEGGIFNITGNQGDVILGTEDEAEAIYDNVKFNDEGYNWVDSDCGSCRESQEVVPWVLNHPAEFDSSNFTLIN